MLQAKPGNGPPQPLGFGGIQCSNTLIKVDVAIGTCAGAARPHDQKCGRAAGEALADVRTTGLLTNGVQLQIKQQVGNSTDPFPLRGFDAQPLRFEHGLKRSIHTLDVPLNQE